MVVLCFHLLVFLPCLQVVASTATTAAAASAAAAAAAASSTTSSTTSPHKLEPVEEKTGAMSMPVSAIPHVGLEHWRTWERFEVRAPPSGCRGVALYHPHHKSYLGMDQDGHLSTCAESTDSKGHWRFLPIQVRPLDVHVCRHTCELDG